MESSLLPFLEHNQVAILRVFAQESKVKGDGLLLLTRLKKDVNLSYLKDSEIPASEWKDIYETKKKELENVDVKIELKDKWIVNLPPLLKDVMESYPRIFLLLQDDEANHFFVGFPQEVTIQNEVKIFYVLVSDPPGKVDIRYHWTVGASQYGREYLEISREAATKYQNYLTFRSNSHYLKILIANSKEYGQKILDHLLVTQPELISKLHIVRKNDQLGSPVTYDYGKYGRLATDSLRYLNSIATIQKQFPDLQKDWKMVELGGGYGGLCYLLSQLVGFGEYTFLEVPEVLMLAHRYLKEEKKLENVTLGMADDLEPKESYDLLISDYAFSELDEECMEKYTERWLRKCKRVYLSMNIWDEGRKKRWYDKLKSIFSEVKEFVVEPATEWVNYVWIGIQ